MKKVVSFLILVLCLIPNIIKAKVGDGENKKYANVVFFVYFKGDEQGKNKLIANFNKPLVLNDYVASISYKDMYNGNFATSMTNYLNTMSYGKAQVFNYFPQMDASGGIVPLELSMDGKNAGTENIDHLIIRDIVNAYKNQVLTDNLDFDGDNIIDNFTVFLAGEKSTVSGSTLVSHKANLGDNTVRWSNKGISTYNVVTTDSVDSSKAAVIVHEFLHSIGYADLYSNENANIESTNSTDDSLYPVYGWDVMAMVNRSIPAMLSYVRSYVSGWTKLDEITTTQDLVLDPPSEINGNQAYIIKSPLNDYEFFVVEYRQKGANRNSIDGFISKSGIIVYRINKTVTNLSNLYGKQGVYVFRENTNANVITNIYGAVYDNKAKIGNKDLNVVDNVLTYSDGSNSGIELTNIRMEDGKMKLTVTIPDAANYDIWEETNYNLPISATESTFTGEIIDFNNTIYAVDKVSNNKIHTSFLNNNTWDYTTIPSLSINDLNSMTMVKKDNDLYLVVTTWTELMLYRLENNNWVQKSKTTVNSNNLSAYTFDNKLFIATNETFSIDLFEVETNFNLKKVGNVYNPKHMFGQVKIIELNNKLHVAIRNSSLNVVELYKFDTTLIKDLKFTGVSSNTYDIVSYNNKVYVASGADANSNAMVKLYVYDGTQVKIINTNIDLGFPKLVLSQGNLYFIGLCTGGDKTGLTSVYAFDESTNKFEKEGLDVTTGGDTKTTSLASINKNIYVMVGKKESTQNLIKVKETVNNLVSINVKPPTRLTYTVGDEIELDGIEVTANYTKSSKVVDNYTVEDFNTDTAGLKVARVIYENVENIFEYRVFEKIVEKPLQSILMSVNKNVLNVGETSNITITYNPTDTTDSKNVIYEMDVNGIVSIQNNIITAISPGTVNIIAKVGTYISNVRITVNEIDINSANITNINENYVKTGSKIEPKPVVIYNGNLLIEKIDYNLEYGTNLDTGKGNVKIIGINKYKGEKNIEFNIIDNTIALQSIEISIDKTTLNVFEEINIGVIYNPNSTTDDKTINWVINNTDIVEIKNGKLIALKQGSTNVKAVVGTKEDIVNVIVNPINIDQTIIENILSSYNETGTIIKPIPTVKYNNKLLENNKDYKLEYGSNTYNSGFVRIKGIDNFTGEIVKNFTIIKQSDKTLSEYLIDAKFKPNISSGYVYGFKIGDTINNIKNVLKNKNIIISGSIISTGTKFTLKNQNYVAVIKGELNGDGVINSADLLKMRQHLLGTSVLTGPYKEAALIATGTTINSADLLRIRQHLLGTKLIEQ